MTKDNARQYIPLIEAWEDGELELNIGSSDKPVWTSTKRDVEMTFSYPPSFYRRRPNPVMVPLGPEDVPPGSVVRSMDEDQPSKWIVITAVSDPLVWVANTSMGWDVLRNNYQISRDGGKTWQKCEKEGKQ